MSLVLYDNAASANALKVRFLLSELGLEYERRWYRLPLPFDAWPKVARPRDSVTERPAFQAAGPIA